MMTESHFEHLLSAYGTRWSAWPAHERDAARALLASSPRLKALWEAESDFDHLLDAASPAPVSASLRERVIASAAGHALRPRRRWTTSWAWLSGAGVAATAFAGAAFGVIIAQQINASLHADSVLYQASLTTTDDAEVLGFEMASLSGGGR